VHQNRATLSAEDFMSEIKGDFMPFGHNMTVRHGTGNVFDSKV
jgi:hypothetical protein